MNAFRLSTSEPLWPELRAKVGTDHLIILQGAVAEVGVLRGDPDVFCLRLDLPDGRTVVLETTLRLVQLVMAAIEGKGEGE